MAKNRATKPGRILCYIDLSEHSTDLVGYAFEYARLFEAELFVLHSVTDISKAAGFYVPHINTEVLEDEVIKAARDKMYALCHKAVGDEVDAEHRLVTKGNPVEEINRLISEKKIDLLIMSHEVSKGSLFGFRNDHVERFMKDAVIPFMIVPVR
ncbi:MAG: universal stress protein [Desulfomonilia bacterium]|jgi:nucleotide-binding universal stress UspA family protein